MCRDCGCGQPGPTRIDGQRAEDLESPVGPSPAEVAGAGPGAFSTHVDPGHRHEPDHPEGEGHTHTHTHGEAEGHAHGHEHGPGHGPGHGHGPQTVDVNQAILSANDRLAERNRGYFQALGLLVLNVVSSPGSGKTTFIRRTLEILGSRLRAGVIVGDLETDNDARRFREIGARAVQITTGTLCHLEAGMIAKAAARLDPRELDLLVIENVGNLVCPAAFDLGEALRVVLLSVTEGEDKPLKYPPIFHSAQVVILNKIDLASAAQFDRATALANLQRASPRAQVFEVSAKTGAGMEAWCDYLVRRQRENGGRPAAR